MKAKTALFLLFLLLLSVFLFSGLVIITYNPALLNPKGFIAERQYELFKLAVFLSLFGLLPAISLTFFVVWRYREGNTQNEGSGESKQNDRLKLVFWLLPLAIISTLAFFVWKNTHELDPFKPISSDKKPLTIEVVSLRWKWLFIYPEQDIATVNYVQFPERTPINFVLTADEAPMNSFWIPELGGQMYAMTGMKTHLNLMANSPGEFSGSAAEISGKGFADMRFIAKATTKYDFEQWVGLVKLSSKNLTKEEYSRLLVASNNEPVAFYSNQDDLYYSILDKYMPSHNSNHNLMEYYQ